MVVMLLATVVAGAGEAPPEADPIVHVVDRVTPMAYSDYVPDRTRDQIVVLHTTISESHRKVWKFARGSRIVSSRKHGAAPWVVGPEGDVLVVAKSPVVPKGQSTEVIVAGSLQMKNTKDGPAGGATASHGGRGPATPRLPAWRSIVKSPGVLTW
jgi:hypothetical protein